MILIKRALARFFVGFACRRDRRRAPLTEHLAAPEAGVAPKRQCLCRFCETKKSKEINSSWQSRGLTQPLGAHPDRASGRAKKIFIFHCFRS
jgi:hypothetical protein